MKQNYLFSEVQYSSMIKKSKLIGKHIRYLDADGKYRVGRVVRVSGSHVTAVNAVKTRHRVHKDKIFGRQFRKRGLEEIDWRHGK